MQILLQCRSDLSNLLHIHFSKRDRAVKPPSPRCVYETCLLSMSSSKFYRVCRICRQPNGQSMLYKKPVLCFRTLPVATASLQLTNLESSWIQAD